MIATQLRRLATAFRPPRPLDEVIAEYLPLLEDLPIASLTASVDHFLKYSERWPNPSQLRAHSRRDYIRQSSRPIASQAEADTYDDAERRQFTDDPCTCLECLDAGVLERPRRFVPIDTSVRVQHPRRTPVFCPGEWIHGHPLAQWYVSRAGFYETYFRIIGRVGLPSPPITTERRRQLAEQTPLGVPTGEEIP